MRPTPTSRGTDWSPFDSHNNYRPLPHSQIVEGDRSRLSTQPQGPTPVPFHPDARSSPVSERGASPRLARVANMNGVTSSRTPSSLSGPSNNVNGGGTSSAGTPAVTSSLNTNSSVTSPQNEKKPPSFLPPRSPVDMQSMLNRGYTANDFNSIRSPLPVGSNLRDANNFGAGTFTQNGSRTLDSSFGPYGSAGLNSANTPGLGFGFEGSDDYGGVLGANGTTGQMFLNKARRDPETNRFANLRLEDMQGDMFGLCKVSHSLGSVSHRALANYRFSDARFIQLQDQHGCRFLQKKLEEGEPTHRDMIFAEIYPHFGELMTGEGCVPHELLNDCISPSLDLMNAHDPPCRAV